MGIKVEDLNRKTSLLSGGESFVGEVRDLSQEELKLTGGGHHGYGKGYGHGKEGDDGIFFSRGPGNSRELFYAPGDGDDDGVFFSRGPGNSRELFYTV
jgi:hypothetical protein